MHAVKGDLFFLIFTCTHTCMHTHMHTYMQTAYARGEEESAKPNPLNDTRTAEEVNLRKVCMYVHTYVRTYVCMHVCMYVCNIRAQPMK
jgi:hypothetical protein